MDVKVEREVGVGRVRGEGDVLRKGVRVLELVQCGLECDDVVRPVLRNGGQDDVGRSGEGGRVNGHVWRGHRVHGRFKRVERLFIVGMNAERHVHSTDGGEDDERRVVHVECPNLEGFEIYKILISQVLKYLQISYSFSP